MPRGGRLLWKYTWQMNSPFGQLSKRASRLQVAGVKAIFINSTNRIKKYPSIHLFLLSYAFASRHLLFFLLLYFRQLGWLSTDDNNKNLPQKTLICHSKNRTTPGRRKKIEYSFIVY